MNTEHAKSVNKNRQKKKTYNSETDNTDFKSTNLKELAEHIYDLDAEVYASLGSLLGRVFNDDRERCVEEIINLLKNRGKSDLIRSELALIGNMARTIKDKEERKLCMTEYNFILQTVMNLPTSFVNGDVLDPGLSDLNVLNLKNRFTGKDHLIICISWTCGSGGIEIGFKLADKLKINFYDEKVFEAVRKRLDADKDRLWDPYKLEALKASDFKSPASAFEPEKHMTLKERARQFSRYHGLPRQDAIFFNQSDLLCRLSEMEDFVIMGRCANVIMGNNHTPHVSLYITAPEDVRIKRTMEASPGLDRKKAKAMMNRMDNVRAAHYRFYTEREWGNADNYDLCINSAAYGIDGTVEFVYKMLEMSE